MTKEMLLSLHKNGLPIDVVIDTLIDEYESRTCESCIFYDRKSEINNKTLCLNEHNYQYLDKERFIYMRIDKSFYCNKWESKND